MKAYINGLGIDGYDETTNFVTGWGTGRLAAEEEIIPAWTEVEIIGHTMMLSPKNKFHDDEYEPVVIVAYNNPEMWKDGDKYRRIAYLPACCLLLENAREPGARHDGLIPTLVHDEFFRRDK